MTSMTLPAFREAYARLDTRTRSAARKALVLWLRDPFHPSLHFKCTDADDSIWSVRITRGYRALPAVDGDTATWYWIGSHADYDRLLG